MVELVDESRGSGSTSFVWWSLFVVMLSAGAAVRICQYAACTSFWSDEASVYFNVTQLTFRQLMGPLLNAQAAPPGFLWIERGLAVALGTSEFSLRLFPLVAGIAALAFFAFLSWKLFDRAVALCAIAFFAFADKLIAYSAEVKQYSCDVLAATLLLFLALWPSRSLSPARRLAAVCIASSVAIWFSHTSFFVFVAITLFLSWRNLAERPVGWQGALLTNLLVILSFVGLYLGSIRFEHQQYLYNFWSEGFPLLPGRIATIPCLEVDAKWLFDQTEELAAFAYSDMAYLLIAQVLLGALQCALRRRWDLLIVGLAPVILVIIAAALRQYPYVGSRLTLFLFPGLFLLVAETLQWLRSMRSPVAALWWILAAPVLVLGIGQAAYHVYSPRYQAHIRPVLEYVRTHRQPSQAVFVLSDAPIRGGDQGGRHWEYRYYWPNPEAPFYTTLPLQAESIHERDFWVIAPLSADFGVEEIKPLLDALRAFADEKDRKVVKQGGAAFLFEKRQP